MSHTDLARTQKELAHERKGIPSDLEQLLDRKDKKISSLEQEMCGLRLKNRKLRAAEESLKRQVLLLNSDVVMLEKAAKMPLTKFSSRSLKSENSFRAVSSDVPRFSSPVLRVEVPNRASQPRNSPEAQAPRDSLLIDKKEEEYQPSVSQLAASPTSEDDVTRLDADAHKRLKQPDRGLCPHCCTLLTAFHGEQYGDAPDDAAKVAFCFSCRRSFTGRDLQVRDLKSKRPVKKFRLNPFSS